MANARLDLDLISKTFAETKSDYKGLALFWLVFGGIHLLSAALGYLGATTGIAPIDYAGNILSPLLMIAAYLLIFRKERRITNRYYLGCFAVWGIPAVILPLFAFAERLCAGIYAAESDAAARILRRAADGRLLTDILLLCACFILCAVLLKKKWLAAVGTAVLLLHLALGLVDCVRPITVFVPVANGMTAAISVPVLAARCCTVSGYLCAGLLLLAVQKRDRREAMRANGETAQTAAPSANAH